MPEIDLTGEDWENKLIPSLLGGLVLNQDSEAMSSDQFLTLDGMTYRKGIMRKDTGYTTFADIPSGIPGIFRKVFKHITAGGVANTFAISDKSFYVLANSGANWHIVLLSGGGNTTTDVNVNGADTVIPVTATTNFAVSDVVGIRLDDGSDHVSTIASISVGVSITIDDAIPGAGLQATSGNTVIEGVSLVGTAEKHVFTLTIPWNDALVFTNGIDVLHYYDPNTTEVQVIPNLPSAGNTICEAIALFDNSLILIRTTEGGANFNQRVRYCDTADFTEWVTGTAGFVDLLDASDKVSRGMELGPYLIIYRDRSIFRASISNSASKRFQFDRMITRNGIMSPASVADIGDRHLVVGNKQVYIYGGGFDVQPIGEPIKELIFGPESELDLAAANKVFAIYIEARNDVLIFYQTASATTLPNKTLRYHADINSWAARKFTNEFLGDGEATTANSLTWNDLIGTWDDLTFNWNTSSITSDLATILFCGSNGQVYEYDFQEPDDVGTAKMFTIETPDFSHHNGILRQDYIEIKCSGGQILVEISLDSGGTWMPMETFTPGSTMIKRRIFYQASSRSFRYRITGSSSFKLSWINLRVTLETEN